MHRNLPRCPRDEESSSRPCSSASSSVSRRGSASLPCAGRSRWDRPGDREWSWSMPTLEQGPPPSIRHRTRAAPTAGSRGPCSSISVRSSSASRRAGWAGLLEAFAPPTVRCRGLVLVGGWQPVGVWNRTLEAFLTPNTPTLRDQHAAGKFIADRDLNTLFRLVLKVGSPDFILSRTVPLQPVLRGGTFVPQKIAPQHWVATLTVPRHEDQGPVSSAANPGICAWLVHALELSGVRPTVTHPKCRFNRSSSCQYSPDMDLTARSRRRSCYSVP